MQDTVHNVSQCFKEAVRESAQDITSFERPLKICLLSDDSTYSTLILLMTICYLRQDMCHIRLELK